MVYEGGDCRRKAEDVTIETEIVVIGGGGAGLAAAVQANQLGSKVLVLERWARSAAIPSSLAAR